MKSKALMTNDAKKVLARRKALIAKPKENTLVEDFVSILVFHCEKAQKHGLLYEEVERVIPYQPIREIPGANSLFLGIIYHNTELWPVLSCHRLFALEGEEKIDFFILCKKGQLRLAIGVQAIIGQLRQKNEALFHFPNENSTEKNYTSGIFQSDISLINLDNLFNLLIKQ